MSPDMVLVTLLVAVHPAAVLIWYFWYSIWYKYCKSNVLNRL